MGVGDWRHMSSHGNGKGTVAGRGASEWIRGLMTAGSGESHMTGRRPALEGTARRSTGRWVRALPGRVPNREASGRKE